MKAGRMRKLLVIAVVVLLAAGGVFARHWYYDNVIWPREIQMRLLGQVVVSRHDLVNRNGFYSIFAQGAFRWDYRVSPGNAVIESLCGAHPTQTCSWTKSAQPYPHVTQDAVLKDGVLTLEESWE
jgi:hypothetical protein